MTDTQEQYRLEDAEVLIYGKQCIYESELILQQTSLLQYAFHSMDILILNIIHMNLVSNQFMFSLDKTSYISETFNGKF